MSSRLKGYIFAIASAAAYGTNPLFCLPLYASGLNTYSVLLLRYAAAIPLLALMILWRGRSFRVSGRQLLTLFFLGMLMAVSSVTLFLSYQYMDAGIASTLLFVYPIMVAVIMAGVYKERVSPLTAGCIAVALVGIGLLYKGPDGATLSLVGTLAVVASSLSYAIYIVGVNKTCVARLDTLTVTFYVLLFGIVLFVGAILLGQPLVIPAGGAWLDWGCVAGLAVFPTAVSFICTTAAINRIGSTPTAILGALEPVTALVIGITLFNETLTGQDVVGLLLILVSVTLVVGGSKVSGALSRRLTAIKRLLPTLRNRGGNRS